MAPLRPLACSGPGELLHVDFTSIEETVPLHEELVIRNVMVMQDHFSKYVVAYVVKDQMAHTAAETLRNGYFGLFGAPAYLVSDQGKAFTGHLISNLCELYGVQKLRTSPYHTQTNGQVERMNQRIIRMIGKLEQDKKACWSVALQPGDVVMVCTDGFVGKRKVKDQWEDGGFVVESQLEDWPVYKVRCPTSDAKQKPKYRILHRNHLLLVTNEDDPVILGQLAQAKVSPVVSNATQEATGENEGPFGPLPSLLT